MNVTNSATSFLRLLTAAPHRQLPWCLGSESVYAGGYKEPVLDGSLRYPTHQKKRGDAVSLLSGRHKMDLPGGVEGVARSPLVISREAAKSMDELDTLIKSFAANLSPIRRNPPTPVYYQPKTRNLASFSHRGSYFPTRRSLLKAGRYVTEAWRLVKASRIHGGGVLKALTHTCLLFCLSRPLSATGAR
ncbi:hypothetical protein GGI42DRAFT_343545 [Trichoderma sp. SZMC 28013]